MRTLTRFIVVALAALVSPAAAMTLSSADISPNTTIPVRHVYPRCGGQNISPELSWNDVPAGTKSFALTVIDMSVKPSGWSHWVVVDLPPGARSLDRAAKTLPGRANAIPSNFGDPYYDGPCPPSGSGKHVYEFTIWALPVATVSFPADMKATDLRAALLKNAIDHASLTGFVTR